MAQTETLHAVIDIGGGVLNEVKLFHSEERMIAYLTEHVVPELEKELGEWGLKETEERMKEPLPVLPDYEYNFTPFWRRWFAMRDVIGEGECDWDVYAWEVTTED